MENTLTFSFNMTKESGGIITTNRPVINADLEAAVYFKPMVWKAKPKNRKIPIMAPALRASLSFREIFLEKINQNAKVPRPNLRTMKTKGEEKLKAVLTRGKVVPQIKVKRSSDSSAFRDGLNTFRDLASDRLRKARIKRFGPSMLESLLALGLTWNSEPELNARAAKP
jgi:hypothetical protein